ncbi:MAG: hypothetical protein ABSH22_12805, partial [Tepidisphaeraceae bacterium]
MPTRNSNPPAIPTGPAWAAILAAGVGCAVLGLLIDLAEAFKSVSTTLNFYNPTGDLSGKTIVAIAIWLIAWAVLHARWKNRTIESPGKVMAATLILILLALLAVF